MLFLLLFYVGNNKNLTLTDKLQLNPVQTDPLPTEFCPKQITILSLFNQYSFICFSRTSPVTEKICWSPEIR